MTLSFRPRWGFTLLAIAAVAVFTGLGRWQWQRGLASDASQAQFAQLDQAPRPATSAELGALPRFSRVQVHGEWDATRQFLLENITHDERAGYDVVSLFRLDDGPWLLVNRGWVPFSGYRDQLPDVTLAAQGSTTLTGRLSDLPQSGLAAGRQPPALQGSWPRVTSFPATEELAQAAEVPLLAPLLLLDPDSGPGYVREWQPPGLPSARHYSYAIQWWFFAATAFGLYLALNLKVAR